MEVIYDFLSMMFPYVWLEHEFMKNALLAIIMVMPLFGLLGTMVVNNRMAFFADSLGHGAFSGVAVGVLLGGVRPILALLVFSVVFAVAITYIKHKSHASSDTVIGVFSAMAVAGGLVMMSYGGSFNKYSAYLIGDLLSITPGDLMMLVVVAIIVVLAWGVIFNQLLLVGINAPFAAARGIRTLWIEMFFSSLLAVVVALSIQWVGILIINSMLVLPAAAARNIANNVKSYHVLSVSFALFSGIIGLIGSYYYNTAAGATIILTASALFFITMGLKSRLLH